jgi:hypothetical protein
MICNDGSFTHCEPGLFGYVKRAAINGNTFVFIIGLANELCPLPRKIKHDLDLSSGPSNYTAERA